MVYVEETIPDLYTFHTCVHTYLHNALKMDFYGKGKRFVSEATIHVCVIIILCEVLFQKILM